MTRLTRRAFVGSLVGLAALSGCDRLPGAQPTRVARVGYLAGSDADSSTIETFRHALLDLGYVEGQTLTIDYRFSDARPERIAELALELVALKPDVITTWGIAQGLAAKGATATIPIVFQAGDPVGRGLVTSLSRPGSNLTGVSINPPGLAAKRLQLLKEAFPRTVRAAYLGDRLGAGSSEIPELLATAPRLALEVEILDVHTPDDLSTTLVGSSTRPYDALVVANDPWPFRTIVYNLALDGDPSRRAFIPFQHLRYGAGSCVKPSSRS